MRIALIATLLVLLLSCNTFDEKEQEPAYIHIAHLKVLDPDGNGYETHDVKDFWVYIEQNALGVFPNDSYIPFLPQNDKSEILLIAGIRDNGISSNAVNYVMLNSLTYEEELISGEELELEASFSYRNDATIRFRETFETSDHIITHDTDNNELTYMSRSSEEAKSGNYSGKMVVNDTLIRSECSTYQAYTLVPTDGRAVYLEMDYKASSQFFIGLVGYNDLSASSTPLKSYYLGLKQTDEWQKIYVNLTSEIAASDLKAYRILFRADYSGSGEEESVYIDNLKFIHL